MLSSKHRTLSIPVRYGIALVSVAIAITTVLFLQQLQVRNPFALIFLAAIAVGAWYGGAGPAILGIALSTLGLGVFLHAPAGSFPIAFHDFPLFCLYFFLVSWIYWFSRDRRRTELLLEQARDQLEAEIKVRTAELMQVNREYQTILDAAPFGIALRGPNGVVHRCNPAYEKMLGFEPGEILGRSAPLPEGEREAWELQECQLRAGDRSVDYEARRLRKDGSAFSATTSLAPLIDDIDGHLRASVELIIDNTKRHAHEAERQMLTALVQHSPDFIGVTDLNGATIFVNRGGQNLFGLETDERVKGARFIEYLTTKADAITSEQVIPLLLQQGGQIEFETMVRIHEARESIPLHCSCFLIPDAKTGEPAFIATIAHDISERKRAEAKLQMLCSVVQNSPDFIGVADMNLRTVFVNRSGQAMFGLEGDEQVTQTHTLDFFAAEHQSMVRDELIPTLLERGQLICEVPARNFKTGHSFPALWTAFVIYDQKTKQPSLLASVTKDITKQQEDRDTLEKALKDKEELLEKNDVLQKKLRRENTSLQQLSQALQVKLAATQKTKFEKIIGGSPALRRTLNRVEQVAATDAPVLITGETGTGKELIAQAIHENSKRAGMPLRSLNCAALHANLFAVELFGHEKGAFTGADRQRLGRFELAEGGTLFLDEVAELPIDLQAALLRVLEGYGFERLGGSKLIRADVRIIAATNRDLQAAISTGAFRPDLYFRLNGFPIAVPSLRERREDIPALVSHFIAHSSAKHEKPIRNIEKRALEFLQTYDWPGNIRELRNVIDNSVITSDDGLLVIDEGFTVKNPAGGDVPLGTFDKETEDHERRLIERALTASRGRISGAAAILQLPYTTLSAKIKALEIDRSKFRVF
jgi:PAS domain S-box-containing protein